MAAKIGKTALRPKASSAQVTKAIRPSRGENPVAVAGKSLSYEPGQPQALTARLLQALQRTSGNASAAAMLHGPSIQRVPAVVGVSGVGLTARKVTLPLTAPQKATAKPANATGVVYSVSAGTAKPTGVTIDPTTGDITIAAGQEGGSIQITAKASDGSFATLPLHLVEKPTAIASTAASGQANYGGQFVHTFSAASGKTAGLERANINEKFATLTAKTPWGSKFTLSANAAGSAGWDLDASGTMLGPDNIDIGAKGIDVGKFIKSASNPTPVGSLPQGFTMTQSLHAKSFPSGALDAAPFTTVGHKRTLIPGPQFEVEAQTGKITENYTGPAAVTKAVAAPTTIAASAPKPKKGTWSQNEVRVSADAIPTTGNKNYSIQGDKLGCSVDAAGKVLIGAKPGTLTVRVSTSKTNFDEVAITISPYVAPAPAAPAAGATTGSSQKTGTSVAKLSAADDD